MTAYKEFIQSEEYLVALKDRNRAFANVERYIHRLTLLSNKTPNAIAFQDLRLEIKEVIKFLDQKEKVCQDLITDKCEDYTDNEVYIESLDSYFL